MCISYSRKEGSNHEKTSKKTVFAVFAVMDNDFYWGRTSTTDFKVHVSGERLSKEEIYQIGYDIAEKIDQLLHLKMEQTLSFNIRNIMLQVYAPDKGVGINCERQLVYEKTEVGENEYYNWVFEKRPSGKFAEKVTPVIYPEGD